MNQRVAREDKSRVSDGSRSGEDQPFKGLEIEKESKRMGDGGWGFDEQEMDLIKWSRIQRRIRTEIERIRVRRFWGRRRNEIRFGGRRLGLT